MTEPSPQTQPPREPRLYLIPWIGAIVLIVGFLGATGYEVVVRARRGGDAWQIGALRDLHELQGRYYEEHFDAQGDHEFAKSLADLESAGLLAHDFAGGVMRGWAIRMERPSRDAWRATMAPLSGEPLAERVFYVDESGIVRAAAGVTATATSAPIGD